LNAPTLIRLIRRALFLAAASATLSAQAPARRPALSPADSGIRITLLTMGQGDQLWELFGHNAIWVHDPATQSDSVYNWGVFDFRTEGFLVRFLQGDMRYTMDAQTIENTLAYYRYLNRRIWAQELDLTPAEARQVVDFIRWNYRPENRQYRYNYYLDNCSTRARDVIDRVLGGRLRAYLASVPTSETYRSHSLRLMQSTPVLVTGVEMALGRPTDERLNADQASFLPIQLMEHLRGFRRADGAPLVRREGMLNEAARAPEPAHVPALWKGLLPMGLVIAAALLGLWFGVRSRIPAAVVVAIAAGFIGIIGTIITLLVTVTDHVAAHRNENLWMLNPVWLLVAVTLVRAMIGGRWAKVARWATWVGAALGCCAVLMHVFGLSRQPNWDVIGLLLPVQLAMAFVAWKLREHPARGDVLLHSD
jgi:hypothetical protein